MASVCAANRLSKVGWSWGCVSAINSHGQTIFVVDAHCGDGKRYVVRADEKLTAFVELEAAIRFVQLNRRRVNMRAVYVAMLILA